MEITAVLLSWQRQYHIPGIAHHLLQCPQITELLIWQNEHSPSPVVTELEREFPHVRVLHSPDNLCTLGRFLAAEQARNQAVFVQDDDLLVHNVPQLVAEFERFSRAGQPKIIANLADDTSSRHWSWWQVHKPAWVELGFGSIFPREFALSLRNWPYDASVLRRKADKVLSVLHPWHAVHAGPAEISRLQYQGQESGRDANALSKRDDHKRLTDQAVWLTREWMQSIGSEQGQSAAAT
jgi:hypothetical protein